MTAAGAPEKLVFLEFSKRLIAACGVEMHCMRQFLSNRALQLLGAMQPMHRIHTHPPVRRLVAAAI